MSYIPTSSAVGLNMASGISQKKGQQYTSQYLAPGDPRRNRLRCDPVSGHLVEIPDSENTGTWPWRLTSMFPERMGPPENPDDFLPTTLTYGQCTAKALALWKARSGTPGASNDIVKKEILPRLGWANQPDSDKVSGRLNKRDQDLRARHGLLNGNFNAERKARGATDREVPKLVSAAVAKIESAAQWLMRTWGKIDLDTWTYECEGCIYHLRAPIDLDAEMVKVLVALGIPVPKVRDLLEGNHNIWMHFFLNHYNLTMMLRLQDSLAFPPLAGYVLEEQGEEDEEQEEVDEDQEKSDEEPEGGDQDQEEEDAQRREQLVEIDISSKPQSIQHMRTDPSTDTDTSDTWFLCHKCNKTRALDYRMESKECAWCAQGPPPAGPEMRYCTLCHLSRPIDKFIDFVSEVQYQCRACPKLTPPRRVKRAREDYDEKNGSTINKKRKIASPMPQQMPVRRQQSSNIQRMSNRPHYMAVRLQRPTPQQMPTTHRQAFAPYAHYQQQAIDTSDAIRMHPAFRDTIVEDTNNANEQYHHDPSLCLCINCAATLIADFDGDFQRDREQSTFPYDASYMADFDEGFKHDHDQSALPQIEHAASLMPNFNAGYQHDRGQNTIPWLENDASLTVNFAGTMTTSNGGMTHFHGGMTHFNGEMANFDGGMANFDGGMTNFEGGMADFNGGFQY